MVTVLFAFGVNTRVDPAPDARDQVKVWLAGSPGMLYIADVQIPGGPEIVNGGGATTLAKTTLVVNVVPRKLTVAPTEAGVALPA